MPARARLLFHSPCFDGIASAVLARDFLQRHEGYASIDLEPVTYGPAQVWLARTFDVPTAIVDFLYHPAAFIWADHHRSAFLNDGLRRHFESRNENVLYDARADSCAGLLWRNLPLRDERFAELVQWAEKIDAARYSSVDEAFSLDEPALRISISLSLNAAGYCEFLVERLSEMPLRDVSELPEVAERVKRIGRLMKDGLERFKSAAELHRGIVTFHVDGRGALVSRYAPYRYFPNARYSVGAVRVDEGTKITAMRNPWIEFESIPLGDLFKRYGGGGHQRVASVILHDDDPAKIDGIIGEIAEALS